MFNSVITVGIQKVGVRSKDLDGRLLRICRVTLSLDFNEAVARELGPDAINVLNGLKTEALESVRMPIGELSMTGAFVGHAGECLDIERMVGVKATAKKPRSDVSGPTISIDLDFAWDASAWVFLGEHCNEAVCVTFTTRQTSLAFTVTANTAN